MFSREICEISMNAYFEEHLRTTASVSINLWLGNSYLGGGTIRRFSKKIYGGKISKSLERTLRLMLFLLNLLAEF